MARNGVSHTIDNSDERDSTVGHDNTDKIDGVSNVNAVGNGDANGSGDDFGEEGCNFEMSVEHQPEEYEPFCK